MQVFGLLRDGPATDASSIVPDLRKQPAKYQRRLSDYEILQLECSENRMSARNSTKQKSPSLPMRSGYAIRRTRSE